MEVQRPQEEPTSSGPLEEAYQEWRGSWHALRCAALVSPFRGDNITDKMSGPVLVTFHMFAR